jgi:alanine racemase
MNPPDCTTWLEIDRTAIQNNLRRLQQIAGRPVMAIIKANAYGHGIVEVACAASEAGTNWFGVARVEEAFVLRSAGVTANILVMGYTSPVQAARAAAEDIRLAVYDADVAGQYSEALQAGQALKVHVKFDTGMSRLGVAPEEGVAFIRALGEKPGIEVEGMFTHFARSDEPALAATDAQIARFQPVVDGLQAAGLRPPIVHAANSAATLYFPQAHYDLVRCGIAIYGLEPSPEAPLQSGFIPALTWKTRLVSIKTIPANAGIGYGHRYVTSQNERIGVIAAGYADGFRRRLGNSVLVGGKRAPVRGGVCMDQCMISLEQAPSARVGDEVVLIGRQGEASIRAEEIGEDWGTVNYEVVCGLAARVPRYYL